jgi:predicted GNAT superfamily acetyltransferase
MIIRPIESKDIEAILELNQTSVKVLSPLDRSAVLSLIGMSALSVVVEKDHQVAGFLIGLTHDTAYESINYAWFNNQYDRFFYVDRIVVSDRFRGLGLASLLYQHIIKWAESHALPQVFAEIDVLPPNTPSLLFHQKFGFKELELLRHSEHKMVSLQGLGLALT